MGREGGGAVGRGKGAGEGRGGGGGGDGGEHWGAAGDWPDPEGGGSQRAEAHKRTCGRTGVGVPPRSEVPSWAAAKVVGALKRSEQRPDVPWISLKGTMT